MRTLGMFAKRPVPGRVKTRLAASIGETAAAELYEAFVRDLLDRMTCQGQDFSQCVLGYAPDSSEARQWFEEASGDDWNLWPQPEKDLGGRILGFFQKYLPEPEDRAILIGSDSPTLPTRFVSDAFSELESTNVVIVPAADGGYCLIGLQGGCEFDRLFEGIDWSSAKVLQQTVERIDDARLSLSLLPVWHDVDSEESLNALRGYLAAQRVAGQADEIPRTSNVLALMDQP